MSIKNPRNTLDQRRSLRREMIKAELIFWDKVRRKKLSKLPVKRQYGISVIRIKNQDIFDNIEEVIKRLVIVMEQINDPICLPLLKGKDPLNKLM